MWTVLLKLIDPLIKKNVTYDNLEEGKNERFRISDFLYSNARVSRYLSNS